MKSEPSRGRRYGVIGQGGHGKVVTLVGQDPSTVSSVMKRAQETTIIYTHGTGRKLSQIWRKVASPGLVVSLKKALKLSASFMLAKHVPKVESFYAELLMNSRILKVFKHTTTSVRTLDVDDIHCLGVRIKTNKGETFNFVFTEWCQQEMLDDLTFLKSIDLNAFVHNILTSLKDLHLNRLIHADIKLDNIMVCGRSFKLNDWGETASFEEMRQILRGSYRSGGMRSPAAWVAMGVDKPGGSISVLMHLTIHGRFFGGKTSLDIVRLTIDTYDSYMRFTKSKTSEFWYSDKALVSYDLYSFGLVLARLSFSIEADDRILGVTLRELAYRLVFYDHPEFLGFKGASAALEWWKSNNRRV